MTEMIRYSLLDLREKGYKRTFVVTNAENFPTIKSLKNCGFEEFAKIKTVGPFNKKLRL